MPHLLKLITVLLLVLTLGLHWVLLQTASETTTEAVRFNRLRTTIP